MIRPKTIVAAASNSKAMSALVGGLGVNGKLIVVEVDFAPIEVTPVQLIMGGKSLQGWNTGTPADEAYARMMSGQARFRVVLAMK